MSNLAKQEIKIPQNISVNLSKNTLICKGPLGSKSILLKVAVVINKNSLLVTSNLLENTSGKDDLLEAKSLQGTVASLIKQAFIGLTSGFRERLQLVGVGYRANLSSEGLELKVGYSHTCLIKIPTDLKVFCLKPTLISISGIDKQKVGNFTALVRSYKVPEPYKGKGILYQDEKIVLKEGKRS